MPITIHGKQYVTVAERVEMAHKTNRPDYVVDIKTTVLAHTPSVVVQATVLTDKGTYQGISAANPSKTIEKMSPYEVAETSAIGRALGFAGFLAVEGIATADEMKKADPTEEWPKTLDQSVKEAVEAREDMCKVHNKVMELSEKPSKNTGKHYFFHFEDVGGEKKICFGKGAKP